MPLAWENICVDVAARGGHISLLRDVNLSLVPGQTHALVGESGSGKSLTALAALRLLPPTMTARGRIVFDGQDILTLASATLRKIRGNHISMIFQEPMSCLNPAMTLGRQIVEPLELHQKIRGGAARRAGIELLARVGISDPAARFDAYPHEISGGMRQRVMIAMAIACRPKALIADEPTTALDVTIQAQILALLAELQRDAGMAILFITHDMAVVSQVAHHVTVMRHGAAVESGETAHVLFSPRHEYTRTLLNCVPRFTDDVEASPTELERHRADSTARPTH